MTETDLAAIEACSFPDSFCEAMDAALAPEANARSRGLSVVVLTKFSTMEERPVGVAYKRDAKDRGVFLNSCPWCGRSLLREINKRRARATLGGSKERRTPRRQR